ncbi:MAG TPA: hypothetical protein VMF90_13150 [Rhizobiaceae bacterium]|nr:hypothetical protein [Rhizobiaceae bacterium]
MVAQMNRLENAARVAMGDDGLMSAAELPRPVTGLSTAARLALLIAGAAALAFLLTDFI